MKYLHYFESIQDFVTAQNLVDESNEDPWVSTTSGWSGPTYSPSPSVHSEPNAGPHEYVDLGLSSGTFWATMNVDAQSLTDSGAQFAWGELTSKDSFTSGNYRWPSTQKYNSTDGLTELELEDDVANYAWGGGWHIPTKEQFMDLINNTTITTVVVDGVTCWKFEANDNYILLPLSTQADDYKYWTSTLSPYSSKLVSYALRNTSSASNPSTPSSSTMNIIERYSAGWIRPVIEGSRAWYNAPFILR